MGKYFSDAVDSAIEAIYYTYDRDRAAAALQPLVKFTPVYTVCYGPAKLIVDFSMEKYLEILLAQALYLGAALGLMFYLYGKGVRKLYVNGG